VSFMETTKRLEISSALAGLAGIVLTVSGLILPWGSIVYGYKEIMIPVNGLQANYALTGIYAMVALCVEILGFFLLLAGMRKVASAILAAAVSFMILQTVMWLTTTQPVSFHEVVYFPIEHIENTGPYTTLVGSSFIMLAALLSLLRLRLSR